LKLFYRRLLAELLLWFLPTIVFLIIYIGNYYFPLYSAVSHLYVIANLVFSVIFLKYLLIRTMGDQWGIRIASVVYGCLFFILIVYYFLVILGLASWHRVITKELIITYASQLPELSEAYNIHFELIVLGLLGLLIICITRSTWIIRFTHSVGAVSNKSRVTHLDYLAIVLIGLLSYNINFRLMNDVFGTDEPVSLTLMKKSAPSKEMANPELNAKEIQASKHYQTTKDIDKKNVILIVVDALRPDHMGVYGYDRNTTPNLNQLKEAENIILIKNVRASCGESSCALTSLGSSRYVHQQPEHPITLKHILQRYGYEIFMILGGDHSNFYNLREGYGYIDHYFDGSMAKGFYMNDDRFLLEKTYDLPDWNNKPVMIQYHLMSTHILGLRQKQYEKFLPFKKYSPFTKEPPNIEFTNSYDNAVLQADAVIAELLDTLKAKNYLNNAVVVITADHGEGLGDHEKYSHSNSVYEELLNIPLIVINYGVSTEFPQTSGQLLSQTDIAPTILHALHMPSPATWTGYPIQTQIKRDFVFFQMFAETGLYDLRDQKHLWKYWKNLSTQKEFAYDLSKDATEDQNLIAQISDNLKNEWRLQSAQNVSENVRILTPQEIKPTQY